MEEKLTEIQNVLGTNPVNNNFIDSSGIGSNLIIKNTQVAYFDGNTVGKRAIKLLGGCSTFSFYIKLKTSTTLTGASSCWRSSFT